MNLAATITQKIKFTKSQTFSSTVHKVGVFSVAIGIGLAIISFSVLLGFKSAITQKLFNFGGNIQVSKISLNNSAEENAISLSSKIIKNQSAISGLIDIQYSANKIGLAKSKTEQVGIILKGIGNSALNKKQFETALVAGRVNETSADSTYSREIIVSSKIANTLNIKLNEEIIVIFPPKVRKLKVVGIYETGLEEIDKNFIFGDLKLIQKLNGWNTDEIGKFEIFTGKNETQTYEKVLENAELDLRVKLVKNEYPAIFDWLKMLDRNAEIVLILILTVAAFNMISVLIIMMMERTEMIGMLKTLGGTNGTVKKLFAFIGFKIISQGLFWGNLLAITFCLAQKYFKIIPLDTANYFIGYVPIEFNFIIIIGLNLLFLVMISLSIFIPIQIITKMSPLVALKFRK